MNSIETKYIQTKEEYIKYGIDVDKVLDTLKTISISIHCWQFDDIRGFINNYKLSGSGLSITGNFPGKARNAKEMRMDYEKVFSLLPGNHRINLHSIYGESPENFIERDKIEYKHFKSWVEWAKEKKTKIDFNCTCFSHPKANSGYTLSNKDIGVRNFWIEHINQSRKISYHIAKELNDYCVHNLWIPDGSKDDTVNRYLHRSLLKESLDKIFSIKYNNNILIDTVESKLFGIGSESYVVGSFEFYFGYAFKNGLTLCLDMGHFHPTESVADKVSSIFLFFDKLLLHISRSIRWDSDHIPILNDELINLMKEIVRAGKLNETYFATDFFDASLNRIGAVVIGARTVLKSILIALLEPIDLIQKYEMQNNNFAKIYLIEQSKLFPFKDVWNYYCYINNVPQEDEVINEIESYYNKILSKRN